MMQANKMRTGQLKASRSHKSAGGLYKMISEIALGMVVVLMLLKQQVESKPKPTSIDGGEQHYKSNPNSEVSNLGLQQNDPIRAIHYHFDQKMDPFLQLHKFNLSDEDSNTVTCNDGSPTGYYKRLNSHSKSWIIYLQGGGYCGGEEACRHRWRHSPHLMSSNYWPKLKSVDGILSSEPTDNPYLWNANHIYVPYCSSDSWTGLQAARTERAPSFTFMGSRIIEKVLDSLFDDVPRESSLYESKFILLAGDSAGATGVILNLDKVNRLVQQRFNTTGVYCSPELSAGCELQRQVPVLRGLADSGWFLDNEPYDYGSSLTQDWSSSYGTSTNDPSDVDCDRQRCTPLQSIRQAMSYWNGQVPSACASRQLNEPWRCYFAYRAYQSLKTPLFVVQWLYDEAQLMLDNIIRPGTIDQWNYVNKLVNEMRHSLENVTALFAPSCFSHSLIIKQSWNQININGFRLPHILNSWEEEVLSNQPTLESLMTPDSLELTSGAPLVPDNNQSSNRNEPTASSLDERRINQALAPATVNFETRTIASRSPGNNSGNFQSVIHSPNSRPRGRKKRRNNGNNNNNQRSLSGNRISTMTNRLSRSTSVLDDATPVLNNNVPDILIATASRQQDGMEKFRLIDSCGWPQCNRDCPYIDQDLSLRPIIPY